MTISPESYAAEIVVHSTYADKVEFSVSDPAWEKTEVVSVPLIKQDLVAPHGGGSIKEVFVSSVHTKEDIFIKLSWADATRDTKISPTEKFPDACAVEIPFNAAEHPSFMMGDKEHPVSIWYWKALWQEKNKVDFPPAYSDFYRSGAIEEHLAPEAEKSAQDLVAVGFSTLQPNEKQKVEAVGEWHNERWNVVFKRRLNSLSGAQLEDKKAAPIAFAVWDGSEENRNGAKSVSVWHMLAVGEVEPLQALTNIEKGKRTYRRYGCVTCHGTDGIVTVANLNSQGGKVPPLNKVKSGFTVAEIKKRINKGSLPQKEDPLGPYPPLSMNAWEGIMDEGELDDLIAYLFSLAPEEEKWE